MKNKTKDIDDEIDFSEAAFKKRFRRITEDELPKPVKMLREAAQNKTKDRVTIYFDSDIVKRFREMAETQGVGYQTLMNEALRSAVDGSPHKARPNDFKEDILKDKKFLRRLKTALSA